MSLYSDLIRKPYQGLSKANASTLLFQAPTPELQLVSTDNTVSGINYGVLRLRNVYQAVNAGPIIGLEGKNAAGNVVYTGLIQAKFDGITNGAEHTYISQSVLGAGASLTLRLTGQTASLHPSAVGSLALGTSALPFSDVYVGNGTRSLRLTHTGVGGTAAMVSDATGLQHVVGSTIVIAYNATTILVGTNTDNTSCFSVGTLATGVSPTGISVTSVNTGKTTFTAFASKFDIGATGNRTSVYDFLAGSTTSGTGTATTHYTFATGNPGWTATTRYGFYGQFTAAANRWNVYMAGDAANYFAGNVNIGNVVGTAYPLEVATSTAAQALARFRTTHATPTGDVISLRGDSSSGYYLLRTQNNANATDKFAIRGDGVIFVGNTVTQTDSALLNVSGRVSLIANQTHDLAANVIASTIVISSAITVADTKRNDMIRVMPSDVQMAGTAVVNGLISQFTVSAQAAASSARGVAGAITSNGAGFTFGVIGHAVGGTGHTGTLTAIQALTVSQAGTALAVGLSVTHLGLMNTGVHITSAAAGDSLNDGVLVDDQSMLVTAALRYVQRASSTADFLRYTDSGATHRFRVDSAGDINLAGSGRRFKAPFSSGTLGSNMVFQTTAANSATYVGACASGTGVAAQFFASAGSDPDNANYIQIVATTTRAYLNSGKTGTGVTVPLELAVDGQNGIVVHLNRDVVLGPTGATTAATDGHVYIPAVAGTPTGVPTARAGYVAVRYDTAGDFLWVYRGGWKKSTVYA